MRILTIFVIAILFGWTMVEAEIINIPEDFETIQAGIARAEDGDTVLVQPGRYVENIDFSGKEIIVASEYLMTGEQVYVVATVIDGNENTNVVTFRRWEAENSVLIGFTIQNGGNEIGGNVLGDGIYCIDSHPTILNCVISNNANYGINCRNSSPFIDSCGINENSSGGMYCLENSNPTVSNSTISENNGCGIRCRNESNPTIRNCTISNNFRDGGQDINGGGICCIHSSPVITDCFIIDNTINGQGGGIYCEESSPTVTGCIINRNEADTRGGGVYIGNESNPAFENCEIRENSVADGGGIYCGGRNTAPNILNCAIVGNTATQAGGGIYSTGCTPSIINCTFSRNISENRGGGGLFSSSRSNAIISNTIFWANSPQEIFFNEEYEASLVTLTFSDIEGGRDAIVLNDNGRIAWGEGNINVDPLFADPDDGDFHLTADSPCIDTGAPDSPLDPDSTRVDIGAFYFPQQNIFVDQEVLNFSHVDWGLTDSLEVVIYNYGKRPLTIFSQTITQDEPAFLIGLGGGEVVIEPESVHSTWVLFTPPGIDHYSGSCNIESDDPDESIVEISLYGSSILSVNPDGLNLPERLELCEVFPNPFNAIANVSYSLLVPLKVSIQVFDLSGRLTATLVNELQPAGNYSVIWNSLDASSGVYLICMKTSDFSDVRKIVLLR